MESSLLKEAAAAGENTQRQETEILTNYKAFADKFNLSLGKKGEEAAAAAAEQQPREEEATDQ